MEPLKLGALEMVKARHLLCLNDNNGSLSIHSPFFSLFLFKKKCLKKREVLEDRDHEWKHELPELLLLNPGTNFFILSNVKKKCFTTEHINEKWGHF